MAGPDGMPVVDPDSPPAAPRRRRARLEQARELKAALRRRFAGICFPAVAWAGCRYQKAFDAESLNYEMPLILNTPDVHHLLRDDPRHRHRRTEKANIRGGAAR